MTLEHRKVIKRKNKAKRKEKSKLGDTEELRPRRSLYTGKTLLSSPAEQLPPQSWDS